MKDKEGMRLGRKEIAGKEGRRGVFREETLLEGKGRTGRRNGLREEGERKVGEDVL